ncbi:hypothetical protein IC229_04265 [Spirosoma sp. BT702]|uniref:Uncharacterized protein n=1 Tax=Spirosoma profusum TaxID=2771354 RepID=A0A927ATC3_9BACT|nr:hypothetical protein [Spirosoma profusum]MBD2699837.1 hypothetical protein [Spirosoma profusum]
MTNELKILSKPRIHNRSDYIKAVSIAIKLNNHLNEDEIIARVSEKHIPHANSREIQDILLLKALQLGFLSEKRGIFKGLATSQLRPDYFLKIDDTSGIIMEVERGRTIANNMDLLDLWKCHICPYANYLFLIVPKIRQSTNGSSDVFPKVVRRLSTFFTESNFTNVDAVFVFGY